MIPRFASREIHFLKTDSGHLNIKAPETYFLDLLMTKPLPLKSFTSKLNSAFSNDKQFMCAAIQLIPDYTGNITEKDQQAFEFDFGQAINQVINQAIKTDRLIYSCIWENLTDTAFILGLNGYETEEQAKNIILSLKKILSEQYHFDTVIGTAVFPYQKYPKSKIPGNALKAIDHAAFYGPGAIVMFNAISLNISGDRFYHLNCYHFAIKEYKQGLKIKQDDSNMLNSLGVCFAINGEIKKAENAFNSILQTNPDETIAIYNIGLLHQIEGEPDKALACFEKAHSIDNSLFEVELILAYLLFKNKQYKRAIPYLDRAEKLNPLSGLVFRIRGEILLAENALENAGIQFSKAIKLNPSDAISLSGYARCMELLDKNLTIALTFAQKSIDIDTDNQLFHERLKTLNEKIEGKK